MRRIVCQFSCGAASAVATKLTVGNAKRGLGEVHIINAFIKEEHPDNRRFLADCERWFGQSITVLRDEKYGASIIEVFRRKRYTRGRYGAPCSKVLKREVLDRWARPDDVPVLGFTVEESDRYQDFLEHHPTAIAPLIASGLSKSDCLAMIERAGIELPAMYRLGYTNSNCIGCVKGGEGYWNKIRRDFPMQFEEMARVTEEIGPDSYLFRDRSTNERFSLLDLDPKAGRHDEPSPECSFFCQIAEKEYTS
jgi:hypothetical protein